MRRLVWTLAFLAWAAAVGAGLTILWLYETSPGPRALAPEAWPAASSLPHPTGRPAIVLTLHPQCPCSHATVAELARLVARSPAHPDIHVLFVAPVTADPAWVRSPLWNAAAAIPGVQVRQDDGADAKRFGARVSGQTFVYDAAGRLRFRGGLTGSRGHQGDNAGRSAVEALLAGRPHAAETFVFGCYLFDAGGDAATWERASS